MNKKTILILAILSLVALPALGMAAVSAPTSPGAIEFTLGGYVKMETDWDSTSSQNKNMAAPVARTNDPNFQHGRLKFTANSTRLNMTMKGPKLWGAQITGYVEVDFDANGGTTTQGLDPLTTGALRLRHAMIRLNWPETELMLGQYWGYFSEFTPETAQDSGCQFVGSPTQRLAQVRVTQKFLGAFTVSGMVAKPTDAPADELAAAGTNTANGETSETPQLQGKIAYEKDLWGKAAFYGVPRGFTAQLGAGWQRARYRPGTSAAFTTFGFNQYNALGSVTQRDQQYLDPWIVMGSLFIPVIPTYSANLAGTASISTQWYVGAGLSAFGEGIGTQTFLHAVGPPAITIYDRDLVKRYGGFIQGQYYFTNQWFINLNWGVSKAFDVNTSRNAALVSAANPGGFEIALPGDLYKMWQQYNLTLWFRPIMPLKFGLQYSYERTDWFQKAGPTITAAPGGNRVSDIGENHRVMFAGYFYF
jgi:hypothetical protein